MIKVKEIRKDILTHLLTPIGPLPSVLDPDGVYPYQSYCETSSRPILKEYNFVTLENDFLSVQICPDLGGKVYSITHKFSGKEVLHVPGAVRQIRILPRFSYTSGGIEVSFPISHTPVQNEAVLYDICRTKERIYVSVGETELRYGMQWSVEYSLGEKDDFLTQRTLFKNPTDQPHPWMSWSNAAFPAYDDTMFQFPNGPVLVHEDEIKTIDWKKDGPGKNSEVRKMAGYFWRKPDCNSFGCFNPTTGIGLYHIADIEKVKGIKLWSYGTDRDLEWSVLTSLNKQPYLEIQGGPIADQSIKYELGREESQYHVEFWLPSDMPLDIHEIELPNINLRPIGELPLFSYARSEEVDVWIELLTAFEKLDITKIPVPPSFRDVNWAPTGLYNMELAFLWAIENDASHKNYWQLYFGTWLLGMNQIEKAVPVLAASNLELAKALLGRVYHYLRKSNDAVRAYREMKDEALILHPQIVVERDKALATLGPETLNERLHWLDKLDALEDEMIIERRIALLIDMEKYEEAKELLLNTKFQKIHQRYERKKLWKKLCEKLKMKVAPFPKNLGEDDLAQFGAYREFDER